MPLIIERDAVLDLYREAQEKKWVIPCFCTENLTTTEAILAATKEYGAEIGVADLPIIIAITNLYANRPQSTHYTHTRRWDIGLKLFLEELKLLTAPNAPFADLRVMVHLDHIQFDSDHELLKWDLSDFSSIMFDASTRPFEENIALTKKFVEERGSQIVVEGACDEIVDASGNEKSELTTSDKALRYLNSTGVDLIVANLGTEHRASAADLKYQGQLAREIKAKIGSKIVLHGTSSVPTEQVANLFADGICKVNIWTTLERDSTPLLFQKMVENAAKVAGPETVNRLKAVELLGLKCDTQTKASLDYFTTVYRQNIIFQQMKKIVTTYLKMWMK